jgi:hypothetical protein
MAHRLANMAGVIAPWTKFLLGFSDRPWVLSGGVRLHTDVGRAFSLLWLISAGGLVGGRLCWRWRS